MPLLPAPFEAILRRHSAIYVIVSPPRSGSTAFARVLWEHPTVRYYCHEPFEVTYYRKEGLGEVAAKLDAPLDLAPLNPPSAQPIDNRLVIKEMPYQVGDNYPILFELATKPLVFLIRDPRLNIASRIEKKVMVGSSPYFPLIETGWMLIAKFIASCRDKEIPYMVVDATDFRNEPEAVFSQVFERLGLDFSAEMLSWHAHPEVELDNLAGEHSHLYRRVLSSTGIQPALEEIPPIDSFPTEHGIRAHVLECLDIYRPLGRDENPVRPTRPVNA